MKRNKWNRIIAIGMIFGMLISSMPISVFADDMILEDDSFFVVEGDTEAAISPETDENIEDIFDENVIVEEDESEIYDESVQGILSDEVMQAAEGDVVDSGSCGENLTWTLDNDGILTISGIGDMEDWMNNTSPWYYNDSICKVVIDEGVTSIGESAFRYCVNMTDVILPSSLTTIKYGSFMGCSGLTSITLPDHLTEIYSDAFSSCSSLDTIFIPENVEYIDGGAFSGCTNLKSINVHTSNTNYSSVDGVLFNKDKTVLSKYPPAKTGNFDFPESVTEISNNAFGSCIGLTEIAIPDSITRIGLSAFEKCSSLSSITIPDSITELEGYTFVGCGNLSTINLPDTLSYIGPYTFYTCRNLKSIALPDSVNRIGGSAFYASGLENIVIPQDVTSLESGTFYNCTHLESITIPKSVKSIGEDAFYECDNLTIFCYAGSYAEQYAQENNIPFVLLDSGNTNKSVIVVSLGDSYASGEGVEPFYGQDLPLAQKVKNEDWLAHRSELSWPGQLEIPGIPGTLNDYKDSCSIYGDICRWYFVASSGATTDHITKKKQKRTVRQKGINNHKPYDEYLPKQLDIFDKIELPVDYVTISIGGNDAKFSKIIETVWTPSYLGSKATKNMLDKVWKRKDQIMADIKKTYVAIKNKTNPDTIILVTGYPQLMDAAAWSTTGVFTSKDEAKLINDSVTAFNKEIELVVKDCQENEDMRIYFVDVEKKFQGKQADLINPIDFGANDQDLDDKAFFSSYSVHPNEDGTKAYAEAVNEAIEYITKSGN